MCEYTQEVKKCLAAFVAGEQPFSAWNVTQAVRSVVGPDVNVSNDEVKGMVHILMEQNDDFCGRFNGKFVEYVPLVEEDELDNVAAEEQPVRIKVVETEPKGAFLDQDVLLHPGDVAILRFGQPVSVVELRAG